MSALKGANVRTPDEGLSRRNFMQRTAAAMVGFMGTGWLITRPDDAWAIVQPLECQKGRVYCKLVGMSGGSCSYSCYDNQTLRFCYGFCQPC
jgi:hypothetical protein